MGMTIEEAILYMELYKRKLVDSVSDLEKDIEAFDMAIDIMHKYQQRKGHWIKFPVGWKCSNCTLGTNDRGAGSFNFCPNCGARMVELQESEEEK